MKKFLVFIISFLIITTSLFSTALADDPLKQSEPTKNFENISYVCLTFDDDGSRENVKQILDCLRINGIQCTFFLTGKALANKKKSRFVETGISRWQRNMLPLDETSTTYSND